MSLLLLPSSSFLYNLRSAYSHSSRFLIKRDDPLFTQTNTTNHDTRNSTTGRSVSRSAPTDAAAAVSATTDATARRVCYDGCSRPPCLLRRMQSLVVVALSLATLSPGANSSIFI
ncbi:hypothetical protein ACFE04_022199 [Oxalis oulophora]